ncbi:glucosaminidase domain-containing protein [Paenibacillus terreus]|uniref:Glucosaminidase domain-containing protein n=1 Tax=Paenibacillus terreus TaxID=1387834 RepID=A0ABV5B3E4_9BACL
MSLTRKQFIEKLAPYAVDCMKKTNISAALTIAQGCLESADGNSGLTKKANNLFGIKGKGDAGSIVMPTKEQRSDGSEYTIDASFAMYSSWGACVEAKANMFLKGVSWDKDKYKPVVGKRGEEAAKAVQACGYATDIRYADKLIAIMDAHNLYQYDKLESDVQELTKEITVYYETDKDTGQLLNNTTYVKLTKLGEVFGFACSFDNSTKKANINGRELQDTLLVDGRAYVQVRPLVKAFGGELIWDNSNKTLTVKKSASEDKTE